MAGAPGWGIAIQDDRRKSILTTPEQPHERLGLGSTPFLIQYLNSVSSCTLLAELGGYEMHIVPGEGRNIKITTTEDLEIFKVMLQTSQKEWLK